MNNDIIKMTPLVLHLRLPSRKRSLCAAALAATMPRALRYLPPVVGDIDLEWLCQTEERVLVGDSIIGEQAKSVPETRE